MARKKPIISPLGQWAYPGEVTIIPSSKITMKGVNYPVLGIDDLGNQQMMMPGGEYTFPGNYVTEYPQMQFGGMSKRKVNKILNENKDLNFVQSMYQPNTPSIMIPGQQHPSTHFMESGDGRVYPTVVQMPDGTLQYLGDNAYDYANQTGQYIEFPNDRQARRFAKSYKKGTGVLEEFGKGGWLNKYQTGGAETSTEQNPERMQGVNINVKRKKVSDSPEYQYDDKGNLLYTFPLINSKRGVIGNSYIPVKNLNPTLEEFVNVASPYYPIDNKLVTDPKINLQPSNYQQSLEEEYVLPQSIGKSFGNLPIVKDDGYSPNRRWVSNLRAKSTGAYYGKDGYAYVLKTNPDYLPDNARKYEIQDKLSLNDERFENNLEKLTSPRSYLDPFKIHSIFANKKNSLIPERNSKWDLKNRNRWVYERHFPDRIWKTAEQMRVEALNNPEIKSWANLHNVDLEYKESGTGDDSFAPKIPESIYANRLVKEGLPVNRPDYSYKPMETYIVQDPSKFNLAGYFPMNSIMKDAEQKVLNKSGKEKLDYNNDDEYFEKESYIKNEMAKRLGINPNAFDNGEYLIHYNQTPITEYTPGKKYGGWLDEFQPGGYVKYVPPSKRPLTLQSSNPSTTDNTRVVTQNTNVTPANRKAAEAGEYARKVGTISQGRNKSAYEKAKEASSLVAQAQQRKGSADPLDYVLDMVNPATYAFAGTDLVGNTAMGVNNLAKGNLSEGAGNMLNAGLNALYLLPAASELRGPLNKLSNSIYKGIPKAFLNKSKAELERKEGVDWLRNWYSQPEIKQRFNQQIYNPAVADDLVMPIYKKNVVTGVIEEPNSTINLNKSAVSDFASGMSKEKYAQLKYGFKKDPIVNLKYSKDIPMGHKNYLGVNSGFGNDMGGYTDVFPEHPYFFYNKFNPVSNWKPTVKGTSIHEGTHWLTTGDRGLASSAKEMFREPFDLSKRVTKHDKYLTKPTEVHARINELRSQYNLGPTVTQSQVDKIIADGLKGNTTVQSRFFELLKDKKSLTNLFNTAMGISVPIAASQLPEQKYGGWLNKYQEGGENLPELNSKIDIANFYKNPLSEKYGIYQDPEDDTYKYYLKTKEAVQPEEEYRQLPDLSNIDKQKLKEINAKKASLSEIQLSNIQPVSPVILPKQRDQILRDKLYYEQDALMEQVSNEIPIIPPSYKEVLESIPKIEESKTRTLPNKQKPIKAELNKNIELNPVQQFYADRMYNKYGKVILTDKANNRTIYGTKKPDGTWDLNDFEVLTGLASNFNEISGISIEDLAKFKNKRGTPIGVFSLRADNNIYGYPGLRLDGSGNVAYHVTYKGADDMNRNLLYNNNNALDNYRSYGCINCQKPSLEKLLKFAKPNDKALIINSNLGFKNNENWIKKNTPDLYNDLFKKQGGQTDWLNKYK